MARISFDQDKVEGTGSFTPIPPGKYLVEITDSDVRPTKSGTGEYVYLVLRVVEGLYEGRLIFDRLNYINQNQQAEEIAQKALKRLCRLCGIRGELTDTQDLHFKRFEVSIGIRADQGYGEQNQVRYPDLPVERGPQPPAKRDEPVHVPVNGEEAALAGAQTQKVAPRPAPAGGQRPWQQKSRF